ncbi:SDR family NAD(P)-dependent oxidoreductase [Mycetocola tolaasinivorans]|uniref:SDR family NAD(P)-dependent oxidoreductase n=1 Tax=Mycetocola tolaasinivorans TaxID=76635 RepID=A0A3L7A307_9MICO|nr:SDR family NAD(P)-dependent oxidoreductase [Mycetocola tolaasinivorans]RLP74577.1 SDR family NAD(P)-dependent oxidoreductase [Mycetocola tolaasinivorans]
MQINNSIAFVTGAGRGLGTHLVTRLLAEGAAKVYAGARDISRVSADWASDERVQLVTLDVTDPESVAAAAEIAADATILINNAGTLNFGGALDGAVEDYRLDLETNLFGVLNTSRAFTPHLIANAPAAIVNVASIVAFAPAGIMVGYSISKAAAHQYGQALRAELLGSGVQVSVAYPAQIDTEMLSGVDMDKASPASVAERIIAGVIAGERDIYPDDASSSLATLYAADPWSLEPLFLRTGE